MLGRIPANGSTNIDTNENLGSTFDTSLKQQYNYKILKPVITLYIMDKFNVVYKRGD